MHVLPAVSVLLQAVLGTFSPDLENGVGVIERDPSRLQPDVAHRLALKLGATPRGSLPGVQCYFRRGGPDKTYDFCFTFGRFRLASDLVLGEDETLPPGLNVGDMVYHYGVGIESYWLKRKNVNIARFLLSAYREEVDPAYREGAENFITLPPKSDREFWIRNFISMGWAAQYVYADNPFSANGTLAIGFGYAMDVVHGAGIAVAAINGKTTGERVGLPALFMGSLLLWKVVFNGWLVKSHMNEYNHLVKSGYRMPRTIRF
jgi:hypothetical protein